MHFNNIFLECIGSHGLNCSSPCPPSWYGALCRFQCSCSDDECDPVHGCTKGPGYLLIINSLLVIFDILVSFYINQCIRSKYDFYYFFVYRKVKCSIRSNWLQYKSKNIRVKSGWFLLSTRNNACGYEIRKDKFSTWHELRKWKFSTWHEIRKNKFSTWKNWQYSTTVRFAR